MKSSTVAVQNSYKDSILYYAMTSIYTVLIVYIRYSEIHDKESHPEIDEED